jgi:hypothetical protein
VGGLSPDISNRTAKTGTNPQNNNKNRNQSTALKGRRILFYGTLYTRIKGVATLLERLMASLAYRKTANASYLMGIAGVIIMPDVVFGLVLELLHTLAELGHLLFELFEASLDRIVEHIFHTGTHETQIIVFYLMLSMALGGLYCLWRTMPRFFRALKENLLAAWRTHKTRLSLYWSESAFNKFKLVALFNAGLTCLVLFGL